MTTAPAAASRQLWRERRAAALCPRFFHTPCPSRATQRCGALRPPSDTSYTTASASMCLGAAMPPRGEPATPVSSRHSHARPPKQRRPALLRQLQQRAAVHIGRKRHPRSWPTQPRGRRHAARMRGVVGGRFCRKKNAARGKKAHGAENAPLASLSALARNLTPSYGHTITLCGVAAGATRSVGAAGPLQQTRRKSPEVCTALEPPRRPWRTLCSPRPPPQDPTGTIA